MGLSLESSESLLGWWSWARILGVVVVVVAPPLPLLAMPFESARFLPSSPSTVKCPHEFLIELDPRRIPVDESATVSIVMLVEAM